MMRDPNRLDPFYSEICRLHKENFPDWRFGQLVSNFWGWIYEQTKRDPFFMEEKEMLSLFERFIHTMTGKPIDDS